MAEAVKTLTLADVLALALKLSAKDRLQLVEKVVSSVGEELPSHEGFVQRAGETWGQAMVRLINELDLSDWQNIEIDDPVEWVKSIRKQEEDRLKPYWDGEK
ncbi:MAG: hypothetical protein SGI73_22070 [Chloroflexota bacterium]|nr:hypothetical protein [Chloroflexota bacterium]